MPDLDLNRVLSMLSYDAATGSFTWRINRKGRYARIGARAECRRPDGYLRIGIDGRIYYIHRLVWLIERGPIPEEMEVDHIDHNPANNRIGNLRLVTSSGNRRNRSRDSRNKSGITGVYWAPHARSWCAKILIGRKSHHLGYFKSLEDAALVRKQAESAFGFHPNHGAPK